MREITTHKVNGVNDGIKVVVADEPGIGGANHLYYAEYEMPSGGERVAFKFQNGPLAETGTNGITHEVLLAILIDRLEGFQSGKFACQANQDALHYLLEAQRVLLNRTRERLARGVEGTHTV